MRESDIILVNRTRGALAQSERIGGIPTKSEYQLSLIVTREVINLEANWRKFQEFSRIQIKLHKTVNLLGVKAINSKLLVLPYSK